MTGDTSEAAVGERIGRLALNFDFAGLGDLAGELEGESFETGQKR